jgi:hypothetical protein
MKCTTVFWVWESIGVVIRSIRATPESELTHLSLFCRRLALFGFALIKIVTLG